VREDLEPLRDQLAAACCILRSALEPALGREVERRVEAGERRRRRPPRVEAGGAVARRKRAGRFVTLL
jgi:hypothetical protein